jgi:general secretion pathway protein D
MLNRLLIVPYLFLIGLTLGISGVSAQSNANGNENTISLSFVNADIESVVATVAKATNKSILVDPKVKGTINLTSSKPLTSAQTINALSSSLRLAGFALVQTSNSYLVVPEADAKLQSSKIYSGKGNSDGDQIITRVFKLNFESANNLVSILRPLISPNNIINAYPGNNTIVITDYASNISRIEKLIASIDSPNASKVETIILKYAQANEVANLISKVMDTNAQAGGEASLKTTILAEPRSNSLLIRGANPERVNQIRSLVAKLDVPTNIGNIWVIAVKNADATKLAITLRAIIAADSSLSNMSGSSNSQINNIPGATNLSSPPPGMAAPNMNSQNNQLGGGPSAAATTALSSSSNPSTGGMIQADPTTNSLIITAPEPLYRNLARVVEQLDKRRTQIYIETMIVELTSANAAELGVQWQAILGAGNQNSVYAGTNFTGPSGGGSNIIALNGAAGYLSGTNTTTPNVLPSAGLNLGVVSQFNGIATLSSLIRAISTQQGTNILSTPNLMTLDNEEARIVVGKNVPIVTGQYAQTGLSPSVTPFQTITRQDVGITLRVKPQISENGTVKLQIFQEVSSVYSQDPVNGIILNKRNIESNVIVDDGQIIVLGGLIEDSYNDGSSKIPLLGDLPLLGNLFRYDNKARTKTNLMVFIRPYVLKTSAQTDEFSNKQLEMIGQKDAKFQQAPNLLQKEDIPPKTNIREPIMTTPSNNSSDK